MKFQHYCPECNDWFVAPLERVVHYVPLQAVFTQSLAMILNGVSPLEAARHETLGIRIGV